MQKPNRWHIKQLWDQLKVWKKENESIDVYLQSAITQFDQLVILRTAIDHEDQIDTVFAGLPEEYMSVVDQVEGHATAPFITELH